MNETRGVFAKYGFTGTFSYEFCGLNKVKQHNFMFRTFTLQNTSFQLNLYPNGLNDDHKDFIDIELDHCGGAKVTVEISFKVQGTPSSQVTTPMYYSSYQCFKQFPKRLLPTNNLQVSCWLKFIGNIPPLYKSLYLSNELSDFTINVKNEVIPVHKIVLAMHSPVFKTMFQSGMSESTTNSTNITDTEPNMFKMFLRCLYTHECDFSQLSLQTSIELFKIAHKYDVKGIENIASTHIKENLKVENCLDLFMSNICDHPSLENILVGFVAKNLKSILAKQNTKFTQLSSDKLTLVSNYM